MRSSLALLAASVCVNQASATILLRYFIDKFRGAPLFHTPSNVNNVCSSQQQEGWDFDDLEPQQPVTHYGGLSLDGFLCDEEFGPAAGPRVGRRTPLRKFLKGHCNQQHGSPPSIGGGENIQFSITHLEVSCPPMGNLLLRYTMPDGETCETVSSCHVGRFTVTNDQCGGAVKVSFVYNWPGPHGHVSKDPKICMIRLYNVFWDCETSRYPVEPPPIQGQTVTLPGQTVTVPGSAPPAETVTVPGLPPPGVLSFADKQTQMSLSPPFTGGLDSSYAAQVTAPPQGQQTERQPPAPVPSGDAPFPPFVPSCISTFMKELDIKCKDNLDVGCYCRNKELTRSLYPCFFAHRSSDDEFVKAEEFFRGLCAKYIPENPEIATGAEPVLASMTITGTPCFAATDYTTVVIPATQVVGHGSTVATSSTIAIPQIVLPTAGPGAPTDVPVFSGQGDGPSHGSPSDLSDEAEAKAAHPVTNEVATEPEGGSPSSPKMDEAKSGPGIGRNPSSPNMDEAKSGPGVGRNPSSPNMDEARSGPGIGRNPSSPNMVEAQSGPNTYGSPETDNAQPRPSLGSSPGFPQTEGAAEGPNTSSPYSPEAEENKTRPTSDRIVDCAAPRQPKSNPGFDLPEPDEVQSRPSPIKPYTPKAGGPQSGPSPSRPGLSDTAADDDDDDEDEPLSRPESPEAVGDAQSGARKNIIKLQKLQPSATQRNSSTTFGGLTLRTGALAAPAHESGQAVVNGASRAGSGLYAGLALLAVMVAL